MSKTENRTMHTNANLLELLPPILRDRALLCAAERKVPVQLPALVTLAAVSASIGKGLTVESGKSRETRSNCFLLLAVGSGIGKSEVFRDIFSPVQEFEKELHTWWKQEAAPRARAGEELARIRLTAIRSMAKASHRPGLIFFRMIQSEEVKREVCRTYLESPGLLADDATPEALGELMAMSNESIALISADARSLLKRLSVTDSKEEAFYLKAFSGDLILTSRVSRKATRLRSPCMTTVLLTQPDAYSRFIKKARETRSGLLPRFLHTHIVTASASTPDIDRRRAPKIRRLYGELLTELIENFRFESEAAVVQPTEDTMLFMEAIEAQCRLAAENDETIIGEVLRRRAEHTWRIALCLHAGRHGAQSPLQPLLKQDVEAAHQIVDYTT